MSQMSTSSRQFCYLLIIDGRFVCRQLMMVLFWTQNSADSTTNRRTGLKRSWSRSHCCKSLPIHQVSSRSLYVSQNLLYIDWLWQCRQHCWTARSHLPTIVMRRFFYRKLAVVMLTVDFTVLPRLHFLTVEPHPVFHVQAITLSVFTAFNRHLFPWHYGNMVWLVHGMYLEMAGTSFYRLRSILISKPMVSQLIWVTTTTSSGGYRSLVRRVICPKCSCADSEIWH